MIRTVAFVLFMMIVLAFVFRAVGSVTIAIPRVPVMYYTAGEKDHQHSDNDKHFFHL